MAPTMLPIALAALASTMVPAAAVASPKVSKVYGAEGRRVAVIKDTAFDRRVYGENGRRIAVIRNR